jgi:hypothetical protein
MMPGSISAFLSSGRSASAIIVAVLALAPQALAAPAPVATTGFTVTPFVGPLADSSAPDSIAVVGDTVWIAYANNGAPDGSGGAQSQIFKFSTAGVPLGVFTVTGHNDGLKYDPASQKLWALQNEDANPNLVVIDPATSATTKFTFGPTPHGGGYDDIVFKNGSVYLSASNPTLDASGKNNGPAIVQAVLQANHTVSVTPVLAGQPEAANFTFGTISRLNLTDPDSMTETPWGDLLLDDQGDGQLVLLRASQTNEPPIQVIPLQGFMQVDDTVFIPSDRGFLLIADTASNIVWKLSSNVWQVGAAFSASTGVAATATTPAVPAYVGQIDLHAGVVLPAVTNLVSPHGLAFVSE